MGSGGTTALLPPGKELEFLEKLVDDIGRPRILVSHVVCSYWCPSRVLTAVVLLKYSIHKNINLWLFCEISIYGCFVVKLLIINNY